MIVVIADDITGAAELAGIACSYGLQTELLTAMGSCLPSCDVLVLATDTRSMTETEASAYSSRLAVRLAGQSVRIFKKTDSALRGHIMAELSAICAATGGHGVLFIPANPTKDRIIRQGIYYVNGKPISETNFSFDPEFPAYTSSVQERFPNASAMNIMIPDVTSEEDIRAAIDTVPADTLLAGAADLFSVWLESMGYTRKQTVNPQHVCLDDIIWVCGSTQSRPAPAGICISSMPVEVYDGTASVSDWKQQSVALYEHHHALALNIPHRHLTGREVAVRLRGMMSSVVRALVAVHRPSQLVIEGGATAFDCLKAIGWNTFHVDGEISQGVVCMTTPSGTRVILKPGSYDWGNFFINS